MIIMREGAMKRWSAHWWYRNCDCSLPVLLIRLDPEYQSRLSDVLNVPTSSPSPPTHTGLCLGNERLFWYFLSALISTGGRLPCTCKQKKRTSLIRLLFLSLYDDWLVRRLVQLSPSPCTLSTGLEGNHRVRVVPCYLTNRRTSHPAHPESTRISRPNEQASKKRKKRLGEKKKKRNRQDLEPDYTTRCTAAQGRNEDKLLRLRQREYQANASISLPNQPPFPSGLRVVHTYTHTHTHTHIVTSAWCRQAVHALCL
ncbi:hypothetical protein LY78DRAFT_455608 [Colletotrichum sublineola]|nr:hypothetical protein LY78DRAFT_455608 [Colletotrichum sublineola]